MVQAKATDFGEAYDYCRVCKKELKELQPITKSAFQSLLYKIPAITKPIWFVQHGCRDLTDKCDINVDATPDTHKVFIGHLHCLCGMVQFDWNAEQWILQDKPG